MSEKEYKSQAQKTLPERWRMVKFGDVVRDVKIDANPENSGLERYVAGGHMQTDDLHIKQWGIIGEGYLGPAFHRKFVKGQVLYGSRRTYLRKVAIAEFDGICANTTFVLESKDGKLLPELLPFVMQSESFTEHSVKKSKGSVNPYVNWKDIAIYEFPLPPKDEQRRIADILWAAEDCIVKKEKLVDEAEFYKKILMTELFSKGIGHREFKDNKVGRIPEEWEVVRLEELTEIITKGTTPTTFGYDFADLGINFIKIESIDESGNFIFKNIAHISDEANNALSRSILKENDILFSIAGALGRVVVVTNEILPANTNQAIAIIRLKKDCKLAVEYLRYYLISPLIQNYITTIAVQTAQANLSLRQVSNFLICIPPHPEQRRITEILSKVEDTIKEARESIEKTRALKMNLINQFLKIGLEERASSDNQQDQRIIYETQVSE